MVSRKVLVCQNRTCRKQGSQKVLEAFEKASVSDVSVEGCSCLGQCGNGPMVLVLPEQVWYWRVRPQEVPAVVEGHLKGGHPVRAMVYRKLTEFPKGNHRGIAPTA